MIPRDAYRIQPRDSMYPQDAPPFNLPAANDEPANEPDGVIDSWPFMASGFVAVCALLWGVAQGWIV